jgi:phage shock protein A
MGNRIRMAPEIEEWAAWLAAPLHSAWRGRPGGEARRVLGQIGFWIAQPGLDAACQRHLVALQRSRRAVADAATSCKRLELQIAELERRADNPDHPGRNAADAGQGINADEDDTAQDVTGQLADLRRQLAGMQARVERLSAASRRLMAEISAFQTGAEATKAAYAAAEEAAKTVWPE